MENTETEDSTEQFETSTSEQWLFDEETVSQLQSPWTEKTLENTSIPIRKQDETTCESDSSLHIENTQWVGDESFIIKIPCRLINMSVRIKDLTV